MKLISYFYYIRKAMAWYQGFTDKVKLCKLLSLTKPTQWFFDQGQWVYVFDS